MRYLAAEVLAGFKAGASTPYVWGYVVGADCVVSLMFVLVMLTMIGACVVARRALRNK